MNHGICVLHSSDSKCASSKSAVSGGCVDEQVAGAPVVLAEMNWYLSQSAHYHSVDMFTVLVCGRSKDEDEPPLWRQEIMGMAFVRAGGLHLCYIYVSRVGHLSFAGEQPNAFPKLPYAASYSSFTDACCERRRLKTLFAGV